MPIILLILLSYSALWGGEKVSIQLKWLHQFQFAGYYAALEKGFFAEEGLDVTLKERDMTQNNIDQVLRGESEYGIADSVLMLYQAQKAPIVIVAPIFQHSPNVLITLKSSGIDSPFKLIGKKVALYPNEADGLPLLAMLHETGVLSKIKRINAPFNMDALIQKKLDADHGYVTNESYQLLQKGIKTNIIHPQHFGVDLYGDMLFTTQNELKKHPKRVAAIKRATIRGWEYALGHPEEMIEMIRTRYAPAKSADQLRFEAKGIASVISAGTIPIGTLDPGRFEYIQNLLSRHGLIGTKIDLDEHLYIESHYGGIDLSPEEKAWLKAHPTIRLAIDRAWPPFEYLDEEDNYRGIAADYISLIEEKLGIRFEPYKKGGWGESVERMQSRQLDMYPCAVKTDEREKYALFTDPYLKFRMVILTNDRVNYIETPSALRHKTVAVVKGYFSEEILRRHYPWIKRLEVDTLSEGLEALESGKAFALIDNTAAITHAIKTEGYTGLKISGELPYSFELAMGVRSDWPELHAIISKALDSITPEERVEIYNRHIQIEYTRAIPWRELILPLIPLILLVFSLIYYTRRLRHANQESRNAQNALQNVNATLKHLSLTDTLTGLANRSMLDRSLTEAIEHARRYSRPFSLIIIDLDHFKKVNDTYGHLAGDEVLKKSASVIRTNSRSGDIVGRWGGEEFLIICPETTLIQGIEFAEKLRIALREFPMFHEHHQSASFGVCQYNGNENAQEIVIRADQALYLAKTSGRNKVALSSTERGSLQLAFFEHHQEEQS